MEAVEGLVDQLFNPAVAFTSAPLDENDNPIPIVYGPAPSDLEDSVSRQEESKSTINSIKPVNMMESYYMVPNIDGSDDSPEYQQLVNKTTEISLNQKLGNR